MVITVFLNNQEKIKPSAGIIGKNNQKKGRLQFFLKNIGEIE